MQRAPADLVERLRAVLGRHRGLAYALLFGSMARGRAHALSDVDLAVRGLDGSERLALQADLEAVTGRRAQVVAIESASPALKFRAFRDGILLVEPDRQLRVAEQARAIVEYLDYRPVERIAVEGILRAAAEGRLNGRT
jgi:predicted nucleotidyltransferase